MTCLRCGKVIIAPLDEPDFTVCDECLKKPEEAIT
jgi:hypothetical protein